MKNDAKKLLIIVSGPSGVGKGTVIGEVRERLAANGIQTAFSVSATTRPKSSQEIDGVHYYFLTKEQFEEMLETGKIAEYNCYSGNYYGTPCKNIDDAIEAKTPMILDIDINGKEQITAKYDNCVTVFILPPDMGTLEKRIRGRARETDTEESIRYRLDRAQAEMEHMNEYDYRIVNDVLEDAAAELYNIIINDQIK